MTDEVAIVAHIERESARIARGEPIPGQVKPNKPPKETRAERQARIATEEAALQGLHG